MQGTAPYEQADVGVNNQSTRRMTTTRLGMNMELRRLGYRIRKHGWSCKVGCGYYIPMNDNVHRPHGNFLYQFIINNCNGGMSVHDMFCFEYAVTCL